MMITIKYGFMIFALFCSFLGSVACHSQENRFDISTLTDIDTATVRAAPIERSSEATQSPVSVREVVISSRQQSSLWSRMQKHMHLERHLDEFSVKQQLNWYKRHPDYLLRVTKRAHHYLYDIVEEVQRRNLPMELALLPIVESAFDPFAYSHGTAAGLWQFIPSTAEEMGLVQNWWYDGRRDAYASTRAALTYLEKLHHYFDDWYLALASYNAGAGNVRRAMRKNQNNNKKTDFWSLKLYTETRQYVPKLLAMSEIIANPEKYGVQLHPIPDKPYFERVYIGTQIDLAYAAEAAQLKLNDFYSLNPGFNQLSTPPNGPHYLILPKDKVDVFHQNLLKLPNEAWIKWQDYLVKRGDSLSIIAARKNMSTKVLKAVNRLQTSHLRIGQRLLLPVTYKKLSDERIMTHMSKRAWGTYHLDSKKHVYTVQRGDTLWNIARQNNTTVSKIMAWNDLEHAEQIHAGKKLLLWAKDHQQSNRRIRTIYYRIRQGDTLSGIASKFRVSVDDIKRWNEDVAYTRYLKPGTVLTLMVNVAQQF